MQIKALIVDDEQRFIDVLVEYIKPLNSITVCGTAKSVQEGITQIKKLQPDLIFLDIELPDGTSFEILSSFPNKNFQIIFTTGHNEYAIKAIKHSAIDYLLKPIEQTEFTAAVNKAIQFHGHQINTQKLNFMLQSLGKKDFSKVAIPSMDGFEFIDKDQIIACEADVNYTVIYLLDGSKVLSTNNLKKVEDVLTERNFFRVHKSYIVNIQHIKKVFKADGGSLEMMNGVNVPIARRRKEEFMAILSL